MVAVAVGVAVVVVVDDDVEVVGNAETRVTHTKNEAFSVFQNIQFMKNCVLVSLASHNKLETE